jgi:hypothetical protein
MAFTTGTATDYHDLLAAFKTYLLAQGWTIDDYAAGATITDPSHLYVTAPGNIGGQQPKMGILTDCNTVTNAYGWQIVAYPQYDAARLFGLQDNSSPLIHFNLWQNSIDYWFYVNDTRAIVVAKIGTYYISMYMGFFLPYALPAEYPYPYFIGATYPTLQPYNLNNAGMRSFCDPGDGAAYYMRRDSLTWGKFANSYQEANSDDASGGYNGPVIWPFRSPFGDFDEATTYDLLHLFDYMRPPIGGKMPMYQCQIIDAQARVISGMLDGVFAAGGFNRISEQTLVEGGTTYRLFIQQNRNTPKGFFAVEEV